MLSKSAPAIPEDLTIEDWRGLLGNYPNALLIGPADATARVLEALVPSVRQPVYRSQGRRLSLPVTNTGTLILDDVAALSPADQQKLLDWLVEPGRLTQVLATTACAVFPRVEDGSFLDVLYYRLNVMSFTVGSRTART